MRSVAVITLALVFALGSADASAQTKKAASSTQTKKTAPAAKPAAKTTKKTTAKKSTTKKTAAKPAAEKAKPAVDTTVHPAAPAPAPDTSSSPSLKDYAKSKVNEAGAAKDTLLKSGAEKIGTAKENLGKKLKDFDPFKRSKADTAKTK